MSDVTPVALPAAQIDHLVVAATSLDAAVRWCEDRLGVTPQAGGRHALMGTHNRLLSLSTARFPRCYLELIAIDPDAPDPGRVRWFDLDRPALQARLAGGPRLIHVVARTPALNAHRDALARAGYDIGPPLAASRGALRWRIAVRDDGRLQVGGALPTLIEWADAHPTDTLPDSPVGLQALRLDGLDARLRTLLGLPGVEGDAEAKPGVHAMLRTSTGDMTLDP